MLISKRAVGLGKRGSVFSNRHILSTSQAAPTEWTLKNSKVQFNFISDCMTGVRLESFKVIASSKTWKTYTRCLWTINTLRNVSAPDPTSPTTIAFENAAILPTTDTFVSPSVVPTVSPGGIKSFSFVWRDVQYNKNDTSKVCDVTLTVSLAPNKYHVDINLSLSTAQSISAPVDTDVCISNVMFPKFCFKSESEENDKTKIFSVPIGMGFTYKWPNKYIRTPRFDFEAFQVSDRNSRTYFSGQAINLSPRINIRRNNEGSPGNMAMPCVIWGDTTDKQGVLIYAHDTAGTHAKGWQWYSDDKNIILKVYDVSDHEIDPYGLGGKTSKLTSSVGYYGNRTNTIGWKLRIRPFESPTKWVAWYGYSIYKEEAVAELEDNWMPKSFYQQTRNGQMDVRDAEVPFTFVIFGPLTGVSSHSGTLNASYYWQNKYKNVTTPAQVEEPRFYMMSWHPNTFNTGTDPNRIAYNIWGWESFSSRPLGQNYGVTGFRPPDYYPVNNVYSGYYQSLAASGMLVMPYIHFSFPVSKYSNYIQTYSGMDLIFKSLLRTDYTYQPADFDTYISGAGAVSSFEVDMTACLAPPTNYEQFVRVGATLGAHGVGAYHDTLGGWGRGCYARSHVYRNTLGTEQTVTHPRGTFTHYFINRQIQWLSGFSASLLANSYGQVPRTGTKRNIIAQGAEGHCDLNLAYVPHSLTYDSQTATSVAMFGINSNVDSPYAGRSDIIYTAGGVIFSAFVEQPLWLERCPGYTICYGDRTILNSFNIPHISNGMDFSGNQFQFGQFSGLNPTTNASVHYPLTHDFRNMDMRAWLALDFAQLRRLTIGHAVLDVLNDPPAVISYLSGAANTEDHQAHLESPSWSGYLNYFLQYPRLMSYEPDYLYHGINQHPLEYWSVERSASHMTPRIVRPARSPTLFDADESSPGDDTIVHFALKHRSNSSILLPMVNWYSGNQSFTGRFDPLSYNIRSSYQVYSLDISSESHGTKTLVDFIPARQSYTFSASITSGQFNVLEFVPVNSLANLEFFSDLTVSYLNVRYSYDATDLAVNSVGIGYSYGTVAFDDPVEKTDGFLAPATQQITNNLPQWSAIRERTDSVGWMLVNSWGQNLETVLNNNLQNSNNIWLETSNLRQRSQLNRTDVSNPPDNKDKTNMLFNSSFAIKDIARLKMPAGWYDLGKSTDINYTQLSNTSFLTTSSILCKGQISATQIIELEANVINDLVASVYVLSDVEFTDARLTLVIEYYDGSISNHYSVITSRSAEWRRLVLPVSNINKQVSRIKYILSSLDLNGEVYFSAPQLEQNKIVTSWNKSLKDTTPVIPISNRYSLIQAINENDNIKIPIHLISDEKIFLNLQLPTRIEKASIPLQDLDAFSETFYGRKVDFNNQIYDTHWDVENGLVLERSATDTVFDIYNKYLIRDLRYYTIDLYGTREDNVQRVLLVGAIRDNFLYVLCQETDSQGKIFYTLKIVVPRPPASRATYLESLIDFEIQLNLDTIYTEGQIPEIVTSIGFSDKYPDYLVINTSTARRLFYKLYFDYGFYDNSTNQLYTIENYNGSKIKIL